MPYNGPAPDGPKPLASPAPPPAKYPPSPYLPVYHSTRNNLTIFRLGSYRITLANFIGFPSIKEFRSQRLNQTADLLDPLNRHSSHQCLG